jgi:hypothetical protein
LEYNVIVDRLRRIFSALGSLPVLLSAAGMSCLVLALVFITSGVFFPSSTLPDPASALTVIPGLTSTPYVPTATPTQAPTQSSEEAGPLPGVLGIGATVQISGTEGSGLNIREQPGLNTGIRFVALDSEVFTVGDGPREADGFVWWYLLTPLDEDRSGWAAADFLSVVVPEN